MVASQRMQPRQRAFSFKMGGQGQIGSRNRHSSQQHGRQRARRGARPYKGLSNDGAYRKHRAADQQRPARTVAHGKGQHERGDAAADRERQRIWKEILGCAADVRGDKHAHLIGSNGP